MSCPMWSVVGYSSFRTPVASTKASSGKSWISLLEKAAVLVDSLLDQELITREETVHNSRKTYYLEPTAEELDFRLLMAGDMLSPLIGNEEIDPQSDSFSQWLMNLQYDE